MKEELPYDLFDWAEGHSSHVPDNQASVLEVPVEEVVDTPEYCAQCEIAGGNCPRHRLDVIKPVSFHAVHDEPVVERHETDFDRAMQELEFEKQLNKQHLTPQEAAEEVARIRKLLE